MVVKEVYQTLRYQNNNDVVLRDGPFKCTQNNAWLGHGYYFWEDSLKPAKYWGKRFHDNKYIICKALCKIDENNCLHLVGSVKHAEYFEEALKQLSKLGELTAEVTVPHVIDFLMKAGQFPFSASRAETSDAFDANLYLTEEDFKEDIIFNKKLNVAKVKLNLVIQLCIYELDKVEFTGLEIVHENP